MAPMCYSFDFSNSRNWTGEWVDRLVERVFEFLEISAKHFGGNSGRGRDLYLRVERGVEIEREVEIERSTGWGL